MTMLNHERVNSGCVLISNGSQSTTSIEDYIRKLENVIDVIKRKDVTFRKLKLENLSGTMIDATIWDDDAISFNKEVVAALPSPVIVDVTSMKVAQFQATGHHTNTINLCHCPSLLFIEVFISKISHDFPSFTLKVVMIYQL